ncbi:MULTISPECIES: MobV family relaxase [Streptococcus]|nr:MULTISPECIES: MobV family relaxase [Streptococcus]MDV5124015.1 MobV family relaxase [Streptococcus pasteurianus]MDV5135699.1 MobV family relaxase [Streptococcus pasteurianus]MDV5151964.1 MobV family relaxase [Streptococcus pasteurianus]MDV5158188.1 MobV family relaxase [Streptococcus pasteurianus]MDV5160203.1 MobV family relaxase [Streptococcus pasteurianus]
MSFAVARMQKVKSGNLVGVGNHNQRNTDNHSNKDIDVERSQLNYDLVNRTENYKRDIEQFINDNKSSSRAVRKDAVLINEWIITSDNPFFKDKDDKEIKDFFDTAKSYFADKFGDNNIRYAQVHLDETTPHMHLGIVPFNDEHKLSAKTVFNRQALQAVQDELPKYLNERGFELERGEKGSERKNLTVPEYKKAKDELKELTTTLEQRKSEVLALSNDKTPTIKKESLDLKDETKTVKVPSGETIGIGKLRHEFTKNEERKTGNVIIPEDKLNALIQGYEDLYKSNEKLKKYAETDLPKRIDYVKEKYKEVVRDFNDLADRYNNNLEKIDSLEKENKSLKNEIKGIYKGFKEYFKDSKQVTTEQVKTLVSGVLDKVKEFVKGGEFEKIHRNETQTRDRDELSR